MSRGLGNGGSISKSLSSDADFGRRHMTIMIMMTMMWSMIDYKRHRDVNGMTSEITVKITPIIVTMVPWLRFYKRVLEIEMETIWWWSHQMEAFSALPVLCAGISPVIGEFPSQRPVTRTLMFSLICAWTNGGVNNRYGGNLRRFRAHYQNTVMWERNGCLIDVPCTLTINQIPPVDYFYRTRSRCDNLRQHGPATGVTWRVGPVSLRACNPNLPKICTCWSYVNATIL